MFDGCRGLRWMPRKIAGSEMITIELSSVAMNTPSVVLDSAVHLYRSRGAPRRPRGSGMSAIPRLQTFTFTSKSSLLERQGYPERRYSLTLESGKCAGGVQRRRRLTGRVRPGVAGAWAARERRSMVGTRYPISRARAV